MDDEKKLKWMKAHVPQSKSVEWNYLKNLVKKARHIKVSDRDRPRVRILIVECSGRYPNETYISHHVELCDIGAVGSTFADLHLIESGLTLRTKYSNGYALIID